MGSLRSQRQASYGPWRLVIRLAFVLDHASVFIVGADPHPNKIPAVLDGKGTVVDPCSYRPKGSHLFETE